jgi:uncharacterized C2H2 Zn-finger protein
MKAYDDEDELTTYVWNHYWRFFTPVEAKAGWAVHAEAKARVGSPRIAEAIWKRHNLAEDPAVMEALTDGVEAFRRRTAKRVLSDHDSEVFVNRCPKCNRVVRTPKAQQCLWCGHDWHQRPTTEAAK